MNFIKTNNIPDYLVDAKPVAEEAKKPWYNSTAPTYAGIFLWFVFWQGVTLHQSGHPGGVLSQGILWAIVCIILTAFACYFFFYKALAMLGLRSGYPLYVVGTSTFGSIGGLIMPGLLMGILQFGWLAVNIYFSSKSLAILIPIDARFIMMFWGGLAVFVGLKGIKYVASVATVLPLIPFALLLVMMTKASSGISSFDPQSLIALQSSLPLPALSKSEILFWVVTYGVGFFATAGAAGVDFGTSNRNASDIRWGGWFGIFLSMLIAAGAVIVIVAGIYGSPELTAQATRYFGEQQQMVSLDPLALIPVVFGDDAAKWIQFFLALSAFPAACFSAVIAANCLKTTIPKVNPMISVTVGAIVSILMAVTNLAADVIPVFVVIGASFSPICGAMTADYLLSGKTWGGPRAGFNPAGWLAWGIGFIVGITPNLKQWLFSSLPDVPMAPLIAYVVGFGVYFICYKCEWVSQKLEFRTENRTQ